MKMGWCIDRLHKKCRHIVKVNDKTLVCACDCHKAGE